MASNVFKLAKNTRKEVGNCMNEKRTNQSVVNLQLAHTPKQHKSTKFDHFYHCMHSKQFHGNHHWLTVKAKDLICRLLCDIEDMLRSKGGKNQAYEPMHQHISTKGYGHIARF